MIGLLSELQVEYKIMFFPEKNTFSVPNYMFSIHIAVAPTVYQCIYRLSFCQFQTIQGVKTRSAERRTLRRVMQPPQEVSYSLLTSTLWPGVPTAAGGTLLPLKTGVTGLICTRIQTDV